jgi:hypothetical protein
MKLTGILIFDIDNRAVLRVNDDSPDGYTDYDIIHDDLAITIHDNTATIRTADDGTKFIDYDNATLGRHSD